MKVVVVGGGWSGSAASLAALKAGADKVVLLERTDMLLGTGLVGGIMRNNGRFTAAEEALAMGGGELFIDTDEFSRHRGIEFPGHKHANLYDVALIEPAVRRRLLETGVEVHTLTRVKTVDAEGNHINAVISEDDQVFDGDVFVETTGTSGPQANCNKYGNGCAMCIFRCPTFGPRVSIAAKIGVQEFVGRKADGSIGAMSGSCKLHKDSLGPDIHRRLDETGVAIIPIPEKLRKGEAALATKACQQYALAEFNENIVLLDTGHAKLMSPYYPLDMLREIPGFENARYEDPYSGGIGNSMRYLALSPRDNFLKVEGADNLFCGGEKAGLLVGHTEAIVTGTLAGHNAVRFAAEKELLEIPDSLAIGDAIAHVNEMMQSDAGRTKKYTFSGSIYFARMCDKGLYSVDVDEISRRVGEVGLTDIFNQPVV